MEIEPVAVAPTRPEGTVRGPGVVCPSGMPIRNMPLLSAIRLRPAYSPVPGTTLNWPLRV